MEKLGSEWNAYYDKTKEKAPRPSLVEAVELVQEKNAALDLGAGALNESKYLLSAGFKKVIAVDSEKAVEERAKTINDDRLEVIVSRFEEYPFHRDSYDLVNAQYSLPFVSPESFNAVFDGVKHSLKVGGVFVGQLFGNNDEWKDRPAMTFHTAEEVQELFSIMEIISFQEVEKDGKTAAGGVKHWHYFEIIARKKF